MTLPTRLSPTKSRKQVVPLLGAFNLTLQVGTNSLPPAMVRIACVRVYYVCVGIRWVGMVVFVCVGACISHIKTPTHHNPSPPTTSIRQTPPNTGGRAGAPAEVAGGALLRALSEPRPRPGQDSDGAQGHGRARLVIGCVRTGRAGSVGGGLMYVCVCVWRGGGVSRPIRSSSPHSHTNTQNPQAASSAPWGPAAAGSTARTPTASSARSRPRVWS